MVVELGCEVDGGGIVEESGDIMVVGGEVGPGGLDVVWPGGGRGRRDGGEN
ncbi:hypothetical protein LINPERPRIM_LOCUS7085 [Linum perenne]